MVSLKCAANFSLLSKNVRIIISSLRYTQSSSQIEETTVIKSTTPSILSEPTFFKRELQHQHLYNKDLTPPREAWLLNFDAAETRKLNLIELHPSIFGGFPRLDLIHLNYVWQKKYKTVNWLNFRTRAELPGSNKKPWPQKGTGRARHGSTTTPQWIHGGWSHGPRGPSVKFYMLPFFTRVRGLIACLTAKFAQNDLKIVDTLEKFPSDDPKFLSEFMDKREWGPSVLIVDKSDIFPRNIALAAEPINHINLMPVYGLNVHSMIKHETLVLTMEALEDIESKLLYQLVRTDLKEVITTHTNPSLPNEPRSF